MPRQRSPKRDKAYNLWKNSSGKIPLKDIAAQLSISDVQIRKWKNEDKWTLSKSITKGNATKSIKSNTKSNVTNQNQKDTKEENKNNNATISQTQKIANSNTAQTPQSPNQALSLAMKGNQNALGNTGGKGGPFGNKHGLKHGAYETIAFSDLTDEERFALEKINQDKLTSQLTLLDMSVIRHIRMQKRIADAVASDMLKPPKQPNTPYSSPLGSEDMEQPAINPMFIGKVTQDKGTTKTTEKEKDNGKSNGKGKSKGKSKGKKINETHDNTITEIKPIVEIIDMIERGQTLNLKVWQQAINQLHKMEEDKLKKPIQDDLINLNLQNFYQLIETLKTPQPKHELTDKEQGKTRDEHTSSPIK